MLRVHKVPTHMGMPDKIVLGLTAKQLLIVLIGCSTGYNIWLHLYPLMVFGPAGMVARLLLALIPAGMALSLALINIAGRPLDVWVLVSLSYVCQPRTYVWRSIRYAPLTADGERKTQRPSQSELGEEALRVPTLRSRERG